MKSNRHFLKESLEELKSNKKKQTVFLKRLVEDDQADERMIFWGGKIALENDNWTLAENLFSSLLERQLKPRYLVGLAQALFKQSRYKEAEDCLIEAVNKVLEPCHLLFVIYKNLGDLYLITRNFSMSEEFYNKAYTLSPQSLSLKFRRAISSLRQKQYSLAEKQFQEILANEPHSTKAWMGLALTRKALKESELAKACLYRCLDFDPRNQRALQLKEQWSVELSTPFTHQFTFSP